MPPVFTVALATVELMRLFCSNCGAQMVKLKFTAAELVVLNSTNGRLNVAEAVVRV